ncbi:hypothetical protein PR202_gb09601 [Eleusine coracana subsp. coracana]|uniref:Aldehyde dehydrogenase domain-containing protein n=1 Tax=Eleusine coracana subsp. coracana TaxID=191504 RepID=A0AAV5EHH9_ELECO|nr:hypothetical protein PR202_gb09601 [Eleusine coracana subsp. coracana]
MTRLQGRHSFSTAITGAAPNDEPIQPSVEIKNTPSSSSTEMYTFPQATLDPRTGEAIAHVAEDINRAVTTARRAFDEGPWPRMPAYERCRVLLRFADLIEVHAEEIAALETWDSGKPLEQAAGPETCRRDLILCCASTDRRVDRLRRLKQSTGGLRPRVPIRRPPP